MWSKEVCAEPWQRSLEKLHRERTFDPSLGGEFQAARGQALKRRKAKRAVLCNKRQQMSWKCGRGLKAVNAVVRNLNLIL